MDIDQITSTREFKEYIRDMVQRNSLTHRTMGQYLRALWGEIKKHKNDTITYALFARLFENAYRSKPVIFNPEWKKIRRPGWTWDRELGFFVTKTFIRETGQWIIKDLNVDPFEILKNTILEQIAERYLLENAENELTENERGKLSNNWSNPEPFTFLSAGVDGLSSEISTLENGQPDSNPTWADLAALLSIGQVCD